MKETAHVSVRIAERCRPRLSLLAVIQPGRLSSPLLSATMRLKTARGRSAPSLSHYSPAQSLLSSGKSRSPRYGHRPSAWRSARSMPCRPGWPVFTRSRVSLRPAARARRGPSSSQASVQSSSARQHGCASHPLQDQRRSPAVSIRIMLDTQPQTAKSLTSMGIHSTVKVQISGNRDRA